jgi:translation initiation factor 3 subunit G
MSTARLGKKWADVDEDEEDGQGLSGTPKAGMAQFETKPDEQGIKMVIDYIERDGRTYKVTKKVKQTTITTWTNRAMTERKTMKKFGKVAQADPAVEKRLCVRSEEEVPIELSKKLAAQASVKDEAEDKFYEESLTTAENLNQQKKAWSAINRERQAERDEAGVDRPAEPDKPADLREAAEAAASGQPKSTYVPPSLRGKDGDAKGKGKGADAQQQEASLRVTNLSEDVKEGDLYDLFGQVGRLQRVFLAKDQTTGQSRGFGFVHYYSREDAQKAINMLNGHGYDNLILQVQFAKPRQ